MSATIMGILSHGRLINFLGICLTLLLILSTADARRYRRTRPSNGDAGRTNSVRPSVLNQPWVILLIAGGGVLVLACCLLNSLRCIHHVLTTRNEKANARRRRTEAGENDNQQGDELAIIDQSQLCQPPPYADIINDVVAPPPPYSAVYVGRAGWDAPPPSDDAELKDR